MSRLVPPTADMTSGSKMAVKLINSKIVVLPKIKINKIKIVAKNSNIKFYCKAFQHFNKKLF